jgi:hypothetical protein
MVYGHYENTGCEGLCYPENGKDVIAKHIADGNDTSTVQVFELFEGKCNDITQEIADMIWVMPIESICDSAADFLSRCGYDLQEARDESDEEAKQIESDQRFDASVAMYGRGFVNRLR